MATLPQTAPKRSSKPVSVREKWRAKTNYNNKRFTGYAPISFAMVAEIGRLTAGKATQILYVILTASLGKIVKEDQPFNESMADLRTAELAELANCDDRTVQRELGDMARRGVISWEQSKKGVNCCTPHFRTWLSLPDYKPGPVAEPEPEETPEETEEDAAAKRASETIVTKKPVHVAAGKVSKAVRLDCGVEALQIKAGDIDASWSAVVQSGVLVVSLTQTWAPAKGVSGLKNQKGLEEKPRQGCRGEAVFGAVPQKRNSGEMCNGAPVSHPRAKELCSLFDDSLQHWCRKTLTNDPVTLLKCCEAAGAMPHNDLVKDVVVRLGRQVRSVTHCVSIVAEARKNWESRQQHVRKQVARMTMCSDCGKEPANVGERCYGCAEKAMAS